MRHDPTLIPRNRRNTVRIEGEVFRPDGSQFSVTIVDLTCDGCGLVAGEQIFIGEQIRIRVPGLGFIDGDVRWSTGRRAGVRFVTDKPV